MVTVHPLKGNLQSVPGHMLLTQRLAGVKSGEAESNEDERPDMLVA
jgi:hypothetical protein